MRTTAATAAAVILCLLLPSVASSAAPVSAAKVKRLEGQLKREKAAHKRDSAAAAKQAATAERTITALTARVDALTPQVAALTSQLSTVQTALTSTAQQRDAVVAENGLLKGNLPQQVSAVAAEGNSQQLQQLVLLPAHNSWACRGDIFYGSTFFSFDFDRRASDGTCY